MPPQSGQPRSGENLGCSILKGGKEKWTLEDHLQAGSST